jgi:hypothetical protein
VTVGAADGPDSLSSWKPPALPGRIVSLDARRSEREGGK